MTAIQWYSVSDRLACVQKKLKKKAKDPDQPRKSNKSVDAPGLNDEEDPEQRRKLNELVEAAGLNDTAEQRRNYNELIDAAGLDSNNGEDVDDDSPKETQNGTSKMRASPKRS